tara:strand:+ start:482 stop:799 length:318 start_codon:yes stop_codon:yes gene_type:complete
MKSDVISEFVAMNFGQDLPHFKSELVWDGSYDEQILDALDCGTSAQEFQPEVEANGDIEGSPTGSSYKSKVWSWYKKSYIEVKNPHNRKSYYPFVDKTGGVIGGL